MVHVNEIGGRHVREAEKVGTTRINGRPTFLEPTGVVLVKNHSKPSGPLMDTGVLK